MVLSDFTEGALDYPFASLGPGISAQAIRARVAGLPRAGALLGPASAINDYTMHEDIDA
ncbi:hypothetical protein LP419_07190 [Massilia sp. H-1]|nr:hypothetical protein LP419_07190 [Massilia sp. H-1]